jgi:hypothetical protein
MARKEGKAPCKHVKKWHARTAGFCPADIYHRMSMSEWICGEGLTLPFVNLSKVFVKLEERLGGGGEEVSFSVFEGLVMTCTRCLILCCRRGKGSSSASRAAPAKGVNLPLSSSIFKLAKIEFHHLFANDLR